jgi:flagellin
MALQINTNIGALMAANSASSINREMETSMARLSTGQRINAARDDAAGMAVANRFTAEIKGFNQAVRNASDAQAMIDVAEGALIEATNILLRMREIAVQAANDTASAADRDALDLEYQDLIAELSRIEDSTTWGHVKVIDGSGGSSGAFTFLIGTGHTNTATADQMAVTFADLTTMTANSVSTDVDDQTNSLAAIVAVDADIVLINAERAQLGAKSNRLNHAIANMTNNSMNLSTALSRVADADFASESTNLAKTQILQQASTAMLAQANASKQSVLQLLQG